MIAPTALRWIAIILVGTGVLDGPRNKGILLFHGGEKAKNDSFRTVGDAGPYRLGVDYNYARRAVACCRRLLFGSSRTSTPTGMAVILREQYDFL